MENKTILKFLIISIIILLITIKPVSYNIKFYDNTPKKGDLIFRLGDELDSEIIANISKSKFSHIGFFITDSLIIHAEFNNINQKVIISSIDDFLKGAKNFGIYRIKNLNNKKIDKICDNLYKQVNKKFILADKNGPNLYCTTLLQREISKEIPLNLKYTKVEFLNKSFLFPQAFIDSNKVVKIY